MCHELLEVHAGVVGPDVPCVPVELHVDPEQANVASVFENLMFRQLILCLHPCLIHVNLHAYCAVAPIEEIDVAAGCPLGNVPASSCTVATMKVSRCCVLHVPTEM